MNAAAAGAEASGSAAAGLPSAAEAAQVALIVARLSSVERPQHLFGTHVGITCDACGGAVVGHRFNCAECRNHDLCSTCWEGEMRSGVVKQAPQLARVNKISLKFGDHKYKCVAGDGFKSMGGGAPPAPKVKKQKVRCRQLDLDMRCAPLTYFFLASLDPVALLVLPRQRSLSKLPCSVCLRAVSDSWPPLLLTASARDS